MVTLFLKQLEIDTILEWYEYANEDSFHYGGSILLLPNEQKVLKILKGNSSNSAELVDGDIEIIADWMEKAIKRKYGSAIYALPIEKTLYESITQKTSELAESRKKAIR